MEETTKSAPSPTIPPQPQDLPNPTIHNLPKSQSRPSSHSKKRKAENVNSYNDNYIKLCNIIKDLRPHFIEVLRTPDFRNSKAADEIRKKMKHVMDVSKQVQVETTSTKISNKPPESEPSSNEIKDTKLIDTQSEEKQVKRHSPERAQEKLPELPVDGIDPTSGERVIPGSYIIGGSNLGWNFITYPGEKAVYYGVTKESRQVPK
ncbi:hypothetical protein ACHQM5_000688 [Ranunculus cassubicifolius]